MEGLIGGEDGAPFPAWLDRSEYPFASNRLELDAGGMHYVDEGEGDPLVFVHGLPTWSFLWRHLILCLRRRYRCIAPDLLGFGLSEAPRGEALSPREHARTLEGLIERLGLRDITLVVHDYGGPIGLAYALAHPENVRRIVLSDTWMWSGKPEPWRYSAMRAAHLMLGSPPGEWLYTRYPAPTRLILALGFAGGSAPRRVVEQYLGPLSSRERRRAPSALLRHVIASGEWYDALWARRALIRDKPTLVLWGGRDRFFGEADLARWRGLFERARVVHYGHVGHFVPEELGAGLCPVVESFLRGEAP